MAETSSANLPGAANFDLPSINAAEVSVPRLITPDDAIERISVLLAREAGDVKQTLLTVAGTAIAAVIALDGTAVEVEKVSGLQECVNCALFVSTQH